MSSVLTHNAAAAYASKPNIQFPGLKARADLLEGTQTVPTDAATDQNTVFAGLRGVDGQSGSQEAGVAPTLDAADLTITVNGETTRYNQGVLG